MADAEVLFAEHRHGVFRYLSRIVGGTEAAHDLTQEVFLRVARAELLETDPSGQRAWVYKIARNLALNHVRDVRRRPEAVELVDQPTSPTQELTAAIREALAELNDLDRDAFLMRETVGLTYEEIASACDLSIEAVRSRLHRVRQQLRRSLAGPIGIQRQWGTRISRGDDDGRRS